MAKTNALCEHVVDALHLLGPASYRFMFGGFGIYVGPLLMGIVADNVLYFRTDETNRGDYETLGLPAFNPYETKRVAMPYYEVPSDVIDDPDALVEWGRKALEAARRHRAANPKKKAAPKKTAATKTASRKRASARR